MQARTTKRLLGLGLTAAVAVGLAATASGVTGAYFSDSKAGVISGTVGNIHVEGGGGTGGNHLDLAYVNMLPGVAQTVTGQFTNTGNNPADIWIVFTNATALSALNNLGNYGNIQINANSDDVFDSMNLNDNTVSCPPGSSNMAHLPYPQYPCKALPNKIKLFSNVGPTGSGSFSVTFNYAYYLSGTGGVGGVFNTYPVSGQQTVIPADGTGAGLPYSIVATQVGQTP